MPTDPTEEWRRLSTLYSEMGDIEIEELADQINDLTPNAQDVLRDELKKRGITPGANPVQTVSPTPLGQAASVNWEPANYRNSFAPAPDDSDASVDYTWKVMLCECETPQDAWRLGQMLKRTGIDCWVERSVGITRVSVGADQLEQAKLVAQQPIAQEVLDLEQDLGNATDYELPTCPQCGAPDPILESVEPSNSWLCESCDHTWSDPAPDKPVEPIEP